MTSGIDGNYAIDRLKDHYKHCIRLSNSNKINPKNAFDLQLIDYMQDLINNPSDNGQTNFKIASSALDVGAKIYSNRVDCIQSEAQKVASSLLMAVDSQNKSGHNQDDTQGDGDTSMGSDRMNESGENDEEGRTKAKKKRTNRNKNVRTVVEKSHRANQIDGQFEEMHLSDPFFGCLSEVYDMSCPLAMAVHNAPIQPDYVLTVEHRDHRYAEPSLPAATTATPLPKDLSNIVEEREGDPDETVIEEEKDHEEDKDGDCVMKDDDHNENAESKDDKFTSQNPQISTQNTVAYSTLHGQTATNSQGTSSRCQANDLISRRLNSDSSTFRNSKKSCVLAKLDNFLVMDRATTIQGCNTSLDETSLSVGERPNYDFDKTMNGDRAFDRQLFEDGANNDFGDDHFDDANSVDGDGPLNQGSYHGLQDQFAVIKPTEYAYTNENHRLLDIWAGPHAFKTAKQPMTAKKEPKSARKRTKLENEPIRFQDEFDAEREELADKEIRHPSGVIRRWKKPLKPQDHNLTETDIVNTIVHTFLRPEDTYHCIKSAAEALKTVDKDHEYTNNVRSADLEEPQSSIIGGFDDVHDDSDDEFRADPVVDGDEVAIFGAPINNTYSQQEDLEFGGERLIDQPVTVPHSNIPFAKTAKKMDIRKLKRAIWDLLLPPEKREELSKTLNNGHNGHETIKHSPAEGGDEGSVAMDSDDRNETVIMNGDSDNAGNTSVTKKTPSPTPSESAVHLNFSNLYSKLPVKYNSKNADDLSQPIAFVTLLHLANEKDFTDFIIEQDELI